MAEDVVVNNVKEELVKAGKKVILKNKGKNVKSVEIEVQSTPLEDVEEKIVELVKPQVLTKKAEKMKEILASQKKFLVNLPPETEYPEYSVVDKYTGEVYESFGEPYPVRINGYNYFVPRGVPVEVPESVYLVLKNQRDYVNEERKLLEAKIKAYKQSYVNE